MKRFVVPLPVIPQLARLIWCAVGVGLIFCVSETSCSAGVFQDGSDNPQRSDSRQGTGDGSETKSTPFVLTPANEKSPTGLVVRAVRQKDPQTPDELTRAVENLINVSAWADAKVYLERLAKAAMSDGELYALYKSRGAEFFYVLHSIDELAPDSQRFAKRVFGAARNYSTSEARIQKLVTTLADPNINVRSAAFRKIKLVGPKAYAAMLEVFGDRSRSKLWPGVRGAVRRLSADATDLLIVGATCGNRQIEVESYFGLANLNTEKAIDLIGFLFLAPQTPDNVKTFAETRLKSYFDGTVDRAALIADLSTKAHQNLRARQKSVSTSAQVNVWQYDTENNKFQFQPVSLDIAGRIEAARVARLLAEIEPQNQSNRKLFLLTGIESAKKQVGPDDVLDSQAVLKELGNPSAAELNELLTESLQKNITVASIGICELLKELGDASVLQTGNQRLSSSPLVQCVLSGERYLQFAALDAIAGLDPTSPYPGSSYVLDLAAFLSQTRGRQRALVGHYASPDSRTFEGIVAATGAQVETARNGFEFYNMAISNPDWNLLLLTDNLLRPKFGQVIQQLRADWRTKYLPIGVVVSNERNRQIVHRLAQTDPLTIVFELNFDTQIVNSQLASFDGLSTSWELTDSSRVIHAAVASQWLEKLASDSQRYGFYNLQKHEDTIYRMLYINGKAEQASKMAAQLGTARAQRELLNFANQNGLNLSDRQSAVQGFTAAVKDFGLLLTSQEIRQQYLQRESSAVATAEVQAIFNDLIATIESSSGAQ